MAVKSSEEIRLIELKEEISAEVFDAAEILLEKDFVLPVGYQLTTNEKIKLKNIIWFFSHKKNKGN